MAIELETASELIVERARQLVSKLIDKRGHDNPPFLPEEYAPIVGVQSIEKVNLGKAGKSGGILLRLFSGSKIRLNINDPLVRQNFSCAHEIGHMLYSELKLEQYINTIEHRTYNPEVSQRKQKRAAEKLCDEAATELLMPTQIFKNHINEFGTTMSSIERLANMYKVSIQSAAIRASEISLVKCMILKWVLQKAPSSSIQLSWPKKKLVDRVLFSPSEKIINPPSIFHEAYDRGGVLKGNISFKVGKQKRNFPAEIKSFGFGDNKYILSLVFING
jgi:Zn-dependent peptidase ImmA (M78 family)